MGKSFESGPRSFLLPPVRVCVQRSIFIFPSAATTNVPVKTLTAYLSLILLPPKSSSDWIPLKLLFEVLFYRVQAHSVYFIVGDLRNLSDITCNIVPVGAKIFQLFEENISD